MSDVDRDDSSLHERDAGSELRTASERERMIAEYLPLAHALSRRYANRGEPLDDLNQVASLGLVKAVDRFDPGRGVQFTTFATHTIVGELKHHFRDKGWAVRTPRRVQELYLEMNQVVAELSQSNGRSPTIHEIAERCGRTDEEILEALEAGHGYLASSLDAPSTSSSTLSEQVEWDVARSTGGDEQDDFASYLTNLPEREQSIVRWRFVDGLSQTEIAERLGISQMHVSRLLRQALGRIRDAYRGPS